MRDFAHAAGADSIDAAAADRALDRLEIDSLGLDAMDRRYLTMIADLYNGGPVGVETLAAGLSEPRDTIEDVIEPYPHPARPHRPHRTRPLPQRARLDPPRPRPRPPGAQTGLFDMEDGAEVMRIPCLVRRCPARRARPPPPPPAAAGRLRKPANWLCLPGRADTCATPLETTALDPTGYGATGAVSAAPRSRRSTASSSIRRSAAIGGMNSDLDPGDGEEKAAIATQFARFVERVPHLRADLSLDDARRGHRRRDRRRRHRPRRDRAYGDVRAAWRNYLATRNQGRPFVLDRPQPGLADADPVARRATSRAAPRPKRMKLAILPGFNVLVPQGKRVGGTFKSTPLCASPGRDRLRA